MKKDNEELLVEANELLRKELEETKAQLAACQDDAREEGLADPAPRSRKKARG